MISDDKKEEIRDASDIVEVVSDYVKLKRSGSSYVGLCPFHSENTPSFHVTPRLRIYKCFGCGASGDVFNFVMEMEGVGFNEAVRSLADRYQISLPQEDENEEYDEEHHLREGIYHALKYAGVFYYRNLKETQEAEKARQYLQKRGYTQETIRKYGLGYAPSKGEALYKAAIDTGINEQYLQEAGLIKPSQRHEGYYDTFRGRLMFPIFNPSGKVIAFAGRILGNEKSAKYINSPQTPVYNKSKVVYAANFAKHEIRRQNEAILVEGYTDVLTLHQAGIKNAVATSGTSLTAGQMKTLHRYGDAITMIYDSDNAGQMAMIRGINIALAEGMDVRLLELPEGEDPDSFVKQFGKDSFRELKKEESQDFLTFMIHKAQNDGRWDDPMGKKKAITQILGSIAEIPDSVTRETFIQHLNQHAHVGDRALLEELSRLHSEKKEEKKRARLREKKWQERQQRQQSQQAPVPHQVAPAEDRAASPQKKQRAEAKTANKKNRVVPTKRPNYEKELIRLMLLYDDAMIDYIGSLCNEQQFEDPELKAFYSDIIEGYKDDKTISVETYANREHPYPELVGEIVLEQYSVSDRTSEKTGLIYKKDKNPFRTAKGALKALKIHYLDRLQADLSQQSNEVEGEERKKIMEMIKEVGRQRTIIQKSNLVDLFPDPDTGEEEKYNDRVFEYKMKHERDNNDQ